MPFVNVEDLEYEHVQPDQYTWLFAILKTLYREKVRFTRDKLKYCLIAFWNCH